MKPSEHGNRFRCVVQGVGCAVSSVPPAGRNLATAPAFCDIPGTAGPSSMEVTMKLALTLLVLMTALPPASHAVPPADPAQWLEDVTGEKPLSFVL
jgi:hypothetical protein